MKKTNKILLLVVILSVSVALLFGVPTKSFADEVVDSDGYVELDESDDTTEATTPSTTETNKTETTPSTTETNTTNTTGASTTNTTGASTTNTTTANTTTNTTSNPTKQATSDYPQAGEFVNVAFIGVSVIAVVAIIVGYVKMKKYSF